MRPCPIHILTYRPILHKVIFSSMFSIYPHPQTSTLFPYTTLFRSRIGITRAWDGAESEFGGPGLSTRSGIPLRVDRKSTRLNSSHRCISYAVFCLKKKKINKHKILRKSKG